MFSSMKKPLRVYTYAIAVSALTDSRGAVKCGTHTQPKETISLPVTSYVSHQSGARFYGPGSGGPWWSCTQALDDPTTNCARFVSLSARRCFLHRVEIWGVYYSTSWRFPPPQISPLRRPPSPSLCSRRAESCSTQGVRGEESPVFWVTPFQRCARCMHVPGPIKLKRAWVPAISILHGFPARVCPSGTQAWSPGKCLLCLFPVTLIELGPHMPG